MSNKEVVLSKEEYNNMDSNEKILEIEKICKGIVENPERHLNHMNTLLFAVKDLNNPKISKITILSIAEIYKQIAPLYKINVSSNNEKLKQVIKKDERFLLIYENSLVHFFDKYISLIYENKIKLKESKNLNNINNDEIINFELVILKAFTELFNSIYQFNFLDKIFVYLIKKIFNLNNNIKDIIVNFIDKLVQNNTPSLLDYKLKLYIYVAKMIKDQKFFKKWNKSILNSLLQIEIDIDFDRILEGLKNSNKNNSNSENIIDVKILNRIEDFENKKWKIEINTDKQLVKLRDLKKRGKISKKQEKLLKQKEKEHSMKLKNYKSKDHKQLQKTVHKEFELASAVIDKKTITRKYLEILNKYYYIIFKILKFGYNSKLFDIALNGLLKYAILINYKFLNDTYQELKDIIVLLRGDLNNVNMDKNVNIGKKIIKNIFKKLLTIIFVLREIKGKSENLWEIEDTFTYKNFYYILFELEKNNIYISCIYKNEKAMILKFIERYLIDIKPMENQIIASYCKSLFDISLFSFKDDIEFSYCCLLLCKIIFQKYSKITRMLENDNKGIGLNEYYEDLDNPYIKNTLFYNMKNDIVKYKQQLLKTKFNLKPKFEFLLSKIETNENLELKYFKKKPSDMFIEMVKIQNN